MHIKGSYLKYGLNNDDAYSVLSKLNRSLDPAGKVLWIAGTNSQSNTGIGMALNQEDEGGEKPLLKLLNSNEVSSVIAGSNGIKIMADGTFELHEGSGRGILDKTSIKDILEDLSD